MIEKIFRWLLPTLYNQQDAILAQLSQQQEAAQNRHAQLLKYFGALAAQNKLVVEEARSARRNMDALAACEVVYAEKLDMVVRRTEDILKSLPVGGSQTVPFPPAVQKKDKAWPRK